MAIEVRPATVFDDVATMVGPKKPDSNVCWCGARLVPPRSRGSFLATARLRLGASPRSARPTRTTRAHESVHA